MVEEEGHVAPAAATAAAAIAAAATDTAAIAATSIVEAERLAGGAMPPRPGQHSAAPAAGIALVSTAAAADGEINAVEGDA